VLSEILIIASTGFDAGATTTTAATGAGQDYWTLAVKKR
jgi:hypothetical protein